MFRGSGGGDSVGQRGLQCRLRRQCQQCRPCHPVRAAQAVKSVLDAPRVFGIGRDAPASVPCQPRVLCEACGVCVSGVRSANTHTTDNININTDTRTTINIIMNMCIKTTSINIAINMHFKIIRLLPLILALQ